MIKRVSDYSGIDDKTFNYIKEVLDKKNTLIDIVDTEKEAINMQMELNVKGQKTEIIPYGNKFKILACNKQDKVDLREAKNSGMFKKLAWGRYYFTKENKLGDKSYDFDDGSIWKVVKGEDGIEYLIKEMNNEDDVVRFTSNDYINEDNYEKFASVLNIDTKPGSVINMMITTGMQKEIGKLIDTQLDQEIYKKMVNNHYIQSKDYNNEIKEILISAINNSDIKNNSDIDELIKKHSEKMVTKTNNFSLF